MKHAMTRLLGLFVIALLAGCAAGPVSRDTPVAYDFGTPLKATAAAATIRATLLVYPVSAPAVLDTPAIAYRAAWQDAARRLTYTQSRWSAPPAELLDQRLRARLAAASEGVIGAGSGARSDYALRVELDEFEQVFDSAEASRGVIVARASLVAGARRALVAQRSFTVARAAASADAAGGVKALAAAGDELAEAITAWTAAVVAQDRK